MVSVVTISITAQTKKGINNTQKEKKMTKETIYQFTVTDLYGKSFDFSTLKGKKVLIVNTASECGLTPQYKDLEAIYEKYKDKNFVIVGFPANNFGSQEPGNNDQIATFCQKNYGVNFQMFEKISVKGSDQHPLYEWLKEKTGQEPSWNFCKYLIKADGTVKFFKSAVNTMVPVNTMKIFL